MASRIIRRRAATVFGVYGSAVFGFLATVVAARELSKADFARFALVFSTTTLLQLFVDLTIDEVVIKYGNRYVAREDWGRFHRLFRIGMLVKLAGGAAGTLAIVGAAFLSPWIWRTGGVRGALLIAALIPLIQQPE
jgi:O-antigen/teichoic acid export membrane protein